MRIIAAVRGHARPLPAGAGLRPGQPWRRAHRRRRAAARARRPAASTRSACRCWSPNARWTRSCSAPGRWSSTSQSCRRSSSTSRGGNRAQAHPPAAHRRDGARPGRAGVRLARRRRRPAARRAHRRRRLARRALPRDGHRARAGPPLRRRACPARRTSTRAASTSWSRRTPRCSGRLAAAGPRRSTPPQELEALQLAADSGGYRVVPARVLATGPGGGFEWTVTLDAGSAQRRARRADRHRRGRGGRPGGGRDRRGRPAVLLAADPGSGVGVRDMRSGQLAVATGAGAGGYTLVPLDPTSDLRVGDELRSGPAGQSSYVAGSGRRDDHRGAHVRGRHDPRERAPRRSRRPAWTWSASSSSAGPPATRAPLAPAPNPVPTPTPTPASTPLAGPR